MRALTLALLLLAPLAARAQDPAPSAATAEDAPDASVADAAVGTDGAAAAPSTAPATQGTVAGPAPSAGIYVPTAGATGYVPPPPGAASPGAASPGLYLGPTVTEGASSRRPRRITDWALVGSGIGLFAGGWLLTWIATSVWYGETTSCSGGLWSGPYSCTHVGGPGGWGLGFSFVPVLGPWIMLGDPYLDTAGEVLPPILFGLVQDLGLIFLIVGLATRHEAPPEPMAAGDWRLGGSAGPTSAFGTLDVAF